MRNFTLMALWTVLGCSDANGDPQPDAPADAGSSEAGPPGAGASATAVQPDAGTQAAGFSDSGADVEALVRAAVGAYDRLAGENCKCLVQQGAFASMEACLAPSASGPTWVPCGTAFLEANLSPDVPAMAQCLADDLDKRATCLSSTACDAPERADCEGGAGAAVLCGSRSPQLLVGLLQACPDLGLLSRL